MKRLLVKPFHSPLVPTPSSPSASCVTSRCGWTRSWLLGSTLWKLPLCVTAIFTTCVVKPVETSLPISRWTSMSPSLTSTTQCLSAFLTAHLNNFSGFRTPQFNEFFSLVLMVTLHYACTHSDTMATSLVVTHLNSAAKCYLQKLVNAQDIWEIL